MWLDAHQALLACPRMARATSVPKSATPAKLYVDETILERLPQDLQDMAAEVGPCIQEAHAMVGQRHVTRHRHVAPPISPASEMVWWGARHGRVVTNAVRSPVRPTMWCMREKVSMVPNRRTLGQL
jgi:hypothetical protein